MKTSDPYPDDVAEEIRKRYWPETEKRVFERVKQEAALAQPQRVKEAVARARRRATTHPWLPTLPSWMDKLEQ